MPDLPAAASRIAPPTTPGPARAWRPIILGIASTAVGVVSVLGGLLCLGELLHDKAIMDRDPLAARYVATFPVPSGYSWVLIFEALLYTALSALLVVAGVLLLNARRSALGLMRHWAVAKALFVPVIAVTTCLVFRQQMQVRQEVADAFRGNPTAGLPPPIDADQMVMLALTLLMSLAWGWALPAYFLVWLKGRENMALRSYWA